MKLEFFIGWRYLATKRKEKFISLISVISITGVAIGVMALIVVLAVMTGFDKDLRDKIVGNYSHITISSFSGIKAHDYPALAVKIRSQPHVTGISPNVQGQVLVKEQDKYFAVGIKGIIPETETSVSRVNTFVIRGSLDALKDKSVIVGKELAFYLGLEPGSTITVYSSGAKENKLSVAGIFKSGMYDYDLNLMFMNAKTAQELLGSGDQYSTIAVKLDNLYLADKVRDQLSSELGPEYTLRTWKEANQNFFAALALEKLTMFIILTLIVLVAAFNIASTLVVTVVEKTRDIGILKALGMTQGQVRRVFTYQGFLIGAVGTALGASGGIFLCLLLKKYQFVKLPQDIYYIDRLPVSLSWSDIAVIVAAALAITLASTVYPAAKAASLKPVDALRYE
jgi:lipoprotein-releasing system permease protein